MGAPTRENIYPYHPSRASAVVFSVLFAIWLVWHTYLAFWLPRSQKQKHRYTIPLFIASALSTAGWITRVVNCGDLSSIPLYAASSSWIVIAPIFVCATLYLLLKHLVNICLPEGPERVLFRISPRWLGRLFISSDVLSFLTQCMGSVIASSGNWRGNANKIGIDVLIVGLALQLATFTIYLAFLFHFVRRVRAIEGVEFTPAVRKVLLGVWIASVFIQVRKSICLFSH
jgi:RTA1 like protein